MQLELSGLRCHVLGIIAILIFSALLAPVAGTSGSSFIRTWGTKSDDSSNGVSIDSSGNIYLTGGTLGFGGPPVRLFLLKYSHGGDLMWQKIWSPPGSGQYGSAIGVDSGGSIFIAGGFSIGATFDHAPLLKLNSSGSILWQRLWNSTGANALAVSPGGRVYITGASYGNLMLVGFNSTTGRTALHEVWGSSRAGGNVGNGIALDNTGNIILTGYTGDFDINYPNGTNGTVYCGEFRCLDGVLLKLNSTGGLQWERIWRYNSSSSSGDGSAVATDSSGNVYVAGYTAYTMNGPDVLTVGKFDSNGTLLWWRNWLGHSASSDQARGIALDSSGNILVTGTGDTDLVLMKLDSAGSLLSLVSWGGTAVGLGIAVDRADNPVIAGSELGPTSGFRVHGVNMALDATAPSIVIPLGVIRTQADLSSNVTGMMMDVSGSTTYAGGFDALLTFGSTFPVSSFTPLQEILLATLIILVARIVFRKNSRSTPHFSRGCSPRNCVSDHSESVVNGDLSVEPFCLIKQFLRLAS